jgi:hypothetical protein
MCKSIHFLFDTYLLGLKYKQSLGLWKFTAYFYLKHEILKIIIIIIIIKN